MAARTIDVQLKIGADSRDVDQLIAKLGPRLAALGSEFNLDPSDVRLLVADLEEAKMAASELNKQASEINGAFRIDASGVEKAAASFDATKKNLSDVVEQQKKALAVLKLTGKDGTEEYAQLRDELAGNSIELRKLEKAAADVGGEVEKTGSFIEDAFKFEAIGKAGDVLSGLGKKADETQQAIKKAASDNADLDPAELKELGSIGGAAYAAGFGDSIADGIAAASAVRQNLKNVIPTDDLDIATQKATALAQSWDKDINEVVSRSGELLKNFNLDTEEGFNLVAFAKNNLANADDDSLDTIKEYSVQFKAIGLSAEESLGLLERGLQNGAFNTDKVADGIKEAYLRITSAGDDATKALDEVTDAPVELLNKLKASIASARSGDISVADSLGFTAKDIKAAFDSGQIGETVKKQLEIAIGNTPLEDVGSGLFTTLFSSPIPEDEIRARALQAGQAVDESLASVNPWDQFVRGAEVAFADVSGVIGPIISPLGSVLTTVGQIGPAVSLLDDKFGIFEKAGGLIKGKLLPSILGMVPALGAQTAATAGATTTQTGLNLAMLANPAFLLVAGIAAIVAAFVIFSKSTEDVIENLQDVNKAASDTLDSAKKTLDELKASDDQAKSVRALADEYERLKGKTDPESVARFAVVSKELAEASPGAALGVRQMKDAAGGVHEVYDIATTSVKAFADSHEQTNAALRDGAIAEVKLQLIELAESGEEAASEIESLKKKREELNKVIAFKNEHGVDISALEKETLEITQQIGILEQGVQQNNALQKENAEYLRQQGLSYKEIQQAQGKSALAATVMEAVLKKSEEASKKVAAGLGDAKKGAEGAAAATKGMGSSAERSVVQVGKLAEEYKKVSEAASSGYKAAFDGVLGIKNKQREVKREIEIARRELASLDDGVLGSVQRALVQSRIDSLESSLEYLRKAEAEEMQAARDMLKERRRLEREAKQLQLALGEIDFNVTDFGPQAEEIKRQIDEVLFGIVNDSVGDELKKQTDQIRQNLKKELLGIDDQIKAVKDAVAKAANDGDPATVTKNAEKLINEQYGQLYRLKDAKTREAEENIRRLQIESQEKQVDDLRKFLDDQDALINAAIDRQIEQLQRGADRITVIDEASYNERLGKRLEILSLEQTKEVSELLKGNDLYIRAMGDVQRARRDLDAAETAAQREEASKRFNDAQNSVQRVRSALLEGNRELLDEIIAADPVLADLESKRAQAEADLRAATDDVGRTIAQNALDDLTKRVQGQKEYLDGLKKVSVDGYQSLLALDRRYVDQEIEIAREEGETLYNQKLKDLERTQAAEERALQRTLERQQALLDQLIALANAVDDDALTAATEAQMRKLEDQRDNELISLERFEAEKTRLVEEAEKGRQVIEARLRGVRLAADIQDIEQQRKHLEERIAVAEEYEQFDEANRLRVELTEIDETLKEKGDVLKQTLGVLQEGTSELFSNLFSNKEDALKDPLKKTLATLAGYIQNLISAKVIDVLLNSIPAGAGIFGAIASFALKPLIENAFSSLTGNLLQNLLSFSTGGRVDSPTLAVVGDAARLGGSNREWIFNDDQLREIMGAVLRAQTAVLVAEMRGLREEFRNFGGRVHVSARDVYEGSTRYAARVRNRIVYRLAA
ncbi:MAG: hypothetical protein KDD67_13750 [Ignavibacteriae bacterium]|nr:hypothetical protein [Ignavibacteriota bacterium]MCB9216149.1 hypothetical protein [Ignavibacteria bacterium]